MPRYLIVDVFTSEPFTGNGLAVFPDGDVPEHLMQAIAREMNLAETTFVSTATGNSYDVRIFTPGAELPFAGHPTIGTAWVLRHLGRISGDEVTQRSKAGETAVALTPERISFERTGSVDDDFADVASISRALSIDVGEIGCDASAFGAPATALRPAFATAGLYQLMVPFHSTETVAGLRPSASIDALSREGVYCFAPVGDGHVKARFFAGEIGVAEDPATGSAAAAFGLYVAARAGAFEVQISQGEEILRPSMIDVRAEPGLSRVGGQVVLVASGEIKL